MPIFALKLDANGVRKGAKEAESYLKDLTGKTDETAKSAIDLKNVLAGVGAGLSLSKVIQDFSAYQSAINNIGKVTDASLAGISKNLKSVDAALGSSTQLAQGYYQVMSAGITDTVKAQEMLVVASKVAKTAGITQAEAIDALAKAMNGYQGELKDAEQAANMFFTTEKLGMTNVAQLAPVMGDLAGVAKVLGVSYNELAGSMAVVTQTSGSTSTAATRMNALFMEMSRPTDNLKKLFKEMGVASGEALIKAKGWPEALKAIQDAAAKSGQSMSTVFGSQEGYQGFIKLMEDNFGKLKEYSGEVKRTTDSLSNAWGRYTKSIGGQFDELSNRAQNLSTTIGESFGGTTLKSLELLNSGLGWLSENFESVKSTAMVAGAGYLALSASRKVYNSTLIEGIQKDMDAHGKLKTLESGVLSLSGSNKELAKTEENKRAKLLESAQATLESDRANQAKLKSELAQAKQTEKMFVGQNNHAAALQRVTALKGEYKAATDKVVASQKAVKTATEAMNKPLLTVGQLAGSAGKSLLAAFGGPIGAAVTAAGLGLAYFSTQESDGDRISREYADAISKVKDELNKTAGAADKAAKGVIGFSDAQQVEKLKKMGKDIESTIDSISKLGTQPSKGRQVSPFSLIQTEVFENELSVYVSTVIDKIKTGAVDIQTAISDVNLLAVKTGDTQRGAQLSELLTNLAALMKSERVEWEKTSTQALILLMDHDAQAKAEYTRRIEEFRYGKKGTVAPTEGAKPPLIIDDSKASAAAATLKSLTSELAKLQMTDAQYQQWQTAQKIADLEKALGKSNPKVKELQALLQNDLEAKFLQSIQEYADPAAAQLEKINKTYKDFKANLTDPRLTEAQRKIYDTQAARQYEKALEGVAGSTQSIAKITREQEKAEAELSGNRTRWWEIRREELNELYGLESSVADKAQVSAAVERQLQIERMQQEGKDAFSFGKLWEETYKRVDEAGADMIEGFLTGSKNGLDSLKNMAIRTVSEMANAMVLRPITVSVMGVMGGAFGGAFGGGGIATGTAQAAGGSASFGMPNIPASSLVPESWTSGISGFMGTTLPGTSVGTQALMGGRTVFTGFTPGMGLGSALTYGGLGGLGYSLLGGALGLPQNKWSSLSASAGGALGAWGGSALGAAMGSSGAISGALAGSMAFPVVGTILGALGGGLLSGVFGGKKPKRPAVWGGAELNLGSDLSGYDFTSAFDTKGYGKGSFAVIESEQYAIAARSRNKASGEFSNVFSKMLAEVSALGLQQADAVQEALPDSYAAAFKAQLAANPVSAEWDFKGDEIGEESFKQAAEELQQQINASMLSAFQGMDFAEYAGKIHVDQSAIEGLTKFTTAIQLTEEAIQSTAQIANPLSDLEQQAMAAKAQLAEWTKAMQAAGVTTEYSGQLIGDYSAAMIGKFIGDMQDSLNPLSQYAQAQKDANKAVDDRLAALKILGATETQLAQVEGLRAQVLEAALGPMRTAFEQDMRVREAQLSGDEALIASMQLAVQHERELADVRARFGAESVQYAKTQYMQMAEAAQLAWQQQQAAAQKLLQNLATAAQDAFNEASQSATNANAALSAEQSHLNAVRSAYLSALNKEASALKSTVDSVTRAIDQISSKRMDLLTGASSPLGMDQRYALTGAELERTFAKAMGGDAQAMADLTSISSAYLDASKEANADFSKYRKDFEKVQAMLAAVETHLAGIKQNQQKMDGTNPRLEGRTQLLRHSL